MSKVKDLFTDLEEINTTISLSIFKDDMAKFVKDLEYEDLAYSVLTGKDIDGKDLTQAQYNECVEEVIKIQEYPNYQRVRTVAL